MTRQTTRPLTEPEIRQLRSRCRHFTGVQNETCEAGVRYDEARGVNPEGRRGPLPCLPDTSLTVPERMEACPWLQSWTRDEVLAEQAEIEDAVTGMLKRLAAFHDPEDRRCPQCATVATAARKVGRCVYVQPCGHRAYQGDAPDWTRRQPMP